MAQTTLRASFGPVFVIAALQTRRASTLVLHGVGVVVIVVVVVFVAVVVVVVPVVVVVVAVVVVVFSVVVVVVVVFFVVVVVPCHAVHAVCEEPNSAR